MRKNLSQILLVVLSLALLGYSASRNLNLIQATLPEDSQITGYLALAALDGGLLIWLEIFRHGCKGGMQSAIAVIMVIVSLIGICVGVVADTFLQSGQRGTTTKISPDTASTVIWLISLIIALNIIAGVLFVLFDPESQRRMRIQAARFRVDELMFDHLDQKSESMAAQIAPQLADHVSEEIRAQYLDGIKAPQLPPPARLGHQTAAPAPREVVTTDDPKSRDS